MKSKNVVAGLGEIGRPILSLISKQIDSTGYDIIKKLNNDKSTKKYSNYNTSFLHICIPFNKNFITNVLKLNRKFQPKCIVIHSTISPYTTKKIQSKLSIPVIYSATRGIHKRMLSDLKQYTKFFALEKNAPNSLWAAKAFSRLMHKCGIKTKRMSNPLTLELSKIVVDTSYYGWLINYAQLTYMIALKNGIDYDEMWSFTDEIHKYLGNRPKMYPGFIGGHCVIPNLELIDEDQLWQIDKINNIYAKKIKNLESIKKKYIKRK